MEKLDYKTCIEFLKEENINEIVKEHVHFVEKRIPESDRPGELDPRVFEVNLAESEKYKEGFPDFSQMKIEEIPIEEIRANMGFINKDITTKDITTTHMQAHGRNGEIPIRIYTPEGEGKKPAVVFFHGGGFVGGSVEVVENACKSLAEKADAIVFNVDYRLAPEHPFPAGLYDCYDAVLWVYKHADQFHVDPDFIAVAGDSAGGNLANGCSLLDKVNGTNTIKFQALLYPVLLLDKNACPNFEWSLEEYEICNEDHRDIILGGIMGLAEGGKIMERLYYIDHSPREPLISQLLFEDLTNLPETLIFTGEFDYLRLEGEYYAKRLAKAGVRSKVIRYKGMDHAFIDKYGLYPQAEDCIREIAQRVRELNQSL